jgi:uncharacterized caspase-like protein
MRLRLSACSRSYVPGIIAIGVAAFFGIPLAGATAEESSVTQPELKIALVIGNEKYSEQIGILDNPCQDAEAMANALTRLGFKVNLKKNLNNQDMVREILDFGQQADGAAVAVLYYAGHGVQVAGENYLLPVDVDLNRLRLSPGKSAVAAEDIVAELENTGGKVKVFILDACRDKLRILRSRGINKGFVSMSSNSRGTLIAYATAPGQTAEDDPTQPNGRFTGALLKRLEEPKDLITILTETQEDVAAVSGNTQMPWIAFSPGQLHFSLKAPAPKIESPERAVANYSGGP